MKKIVFIAIVFYISFLAAYSVKPIQHYTTMNGLSQSQVNHLLQDDRGFVWTGTLAGGINRLDGVSIRKEYNKILDDLSVSSMALFNKKVYFSTDTGLFSVDELGVTKLETPDKIKYRALFSSGNQLFVFCYKNNKINLGTYLEGKWHFTPLDIPYHANIQTSGFMNDGSFYILTRNLGLFTVTDSGKVENLQNISRLMVNNISMAQDGSLLIASENGPFKWKNGVLEKIAEIAGHNITAIYQGKSQVIYMGTDSSGFFVLYPDGKLDAYTKENSLIPNESIESFMEDSWGNLWIGTDGAGIFVYIPFFLVNFAVFENVGAVFAFEQLDNDRILMASNYGISTYNKKTNELERLFEKCLQPDNICAAKNIYTVALIKDEKSLLIGTRYGLFKGSLEPPFKLEKIIYKIPTTGEKNIIYSKFMPYKSGILFASEYGLFLYEKGVVTPMNEVLGIEAGRKMKNLRVDSKNNIYMQAEDYTLLVYSDSLKKIISAPEVISQRIHFISNIFIDNYDNLWIYGKEGLFRMNLEQKELVPIKNFDVNIHQDLSFLYTSKEKKTWVGTNKGIVLVTNDTVNYNYTSSDGLIMEEANSNAVIEDSDGDMWFGIDISASWFRRNIEKYASSSHVPQIYIEGMKIYDDQYPLQKKEINLKYHQNYLSFDFISPAPADASLVKYKYILKNFDKDWGITTYNSVRYTNIPPGEYEFIIKAVNKSGVESNEPQTLKLIIRPPFWQTLWFKSLLIFTIITLLFLYIRISVRKIKLKSEFLEKVVTERTEQLSLRLQEIEELKSKFEKLSTVDELTKLYNRRFFFERIREELNRVKRVSSSKLAIIIMDIDHFKHTNDTYGHQAGDAVLRQLSDILKTAARESDILARYGGEEFVVACEIKERDEIGKVAERIRKSVESADFILPDNQKIKKTISLGAAIFDENSDVESVIADADLMLYKSKDTGRNRYFIFPS